MRRKMPIMKKPLLYGELFKTVIRKRILQKDYHYMARILMKKNQNYAKMVDELASLETQLEREKNRLSTATAADKPK